MASCQSLTDSTYTARSLLIQSTQKGSVNLQHFIQKKSSQYAQFFLIPPQMHHPHSEPVVALANGQNSSSEHEYGPFLTELLALRTEPGHG